MVAWIGPPDSYYDPPEPRECCALAEDDPDHDREACWQEQAEAAAEAKADRIRDERGWDDVH